jgi:hypothetical protein
MRLDKSFLVATFVLLGGMAAPASAVYLNPDGHGQALIYPYYTARSAEGNPFNTYISLANTDLMTARVLRVRFREAANGREVAGFNLFLGPTDMWTAAVVPTSRGTRILTADRSCVDPPMTRLNAQLAELRLEAGGEEGYVEIIEMASTSLGTDTGIAVSPVNGEPEDCDYVRNPANVVPDLDGPLGGLMGTLTLINVASGEDFTVTADALADVATQPFFRPPSDPYPDFDAVQVNPRSHMFVDGKSYELSWSNGMEAVSSVLTAVGVMNEYILDRGTASQTDWVLTYPTRRFFPDPHPLFAPPTNGLLSFLVSDREGRTVENTQCSGWFGFCENALELGTTNVIAMIRRDGPAASLLGSAHPLPRWAGGTVLDSGFIVARQAPYRDTTNGGPGRLTSLPGSTSFDAATAVTTTGTFVVRGLPVTGLAVRTFRNGTLSCDGGKCQGNYGGSFSHRYKRLIEPVTP